MIQLDVQLCYGSRPLRPGCARFIDGDSAVAWLRELTTWNVPLDEVELFVLPYSAKDLRPRGVLAVHPLCASAGSGPQYGRVAGRLFVPVEATFRPVVADQEWDRLLGAGIACIWHPHVGLVGCEEADRLSVADLLQVKPPGNRDWSHADPGLPETPRLQTLLVPAPPPFMEFIDTGRDDIGVDAPQLKKLPRAPGERRPLLPSFDWLPSLPPLHKLLTTPLAYVARALAQHAPTGASAPTWVNKLENWATRVLQDWSKIMRQRSRELDRLLNLLESNPDEGLRYAIPTAHEAPRGIAPPGSRLAPHNFDLTGGGGPADVWNIPYDMQLKLNERYRALADREVALRRYRRAAYIHARLLNDYPAAAAVLVAGGHFREAAAIYTDRLHRPWDAANCLEQAGLLHEAIPLYQQLKQFEKVGDLHARLDETDAARDAWKQAVDHCLLSRDPLGAARICDQKLADPDAAVGSLLAGWRRAWASEQCLTGMFTLLGRLGHHESVIRRLHALHESNDPVDGEPPPLTGAGAQPVPLQTVSALTTLTEQYPDQRVQTVAADIARLVTSRALVSRNAEAQSCVRLLSRLVPADRLLSHDCRRFVGDLHRAAAEADPPLRRNTARSKAVPQPIKTVPLKWDMQWKGAAATTRGLYLAGCFGRKLLLFGCRWDQFQLQDARVNLSTTTSFSDRPLLFAVDPDERFSFVPMMPLGGPALSPVVFPNFDEPNRTLTARSTGDVTDETVAIDIADGLLWTLEHTSNVVKCMNSKGVVQRSWQIKDYPDQQALTPQQKAAMHARAGEVFVGINQVLWRLTGTNETAHECRSPIRSIVGSASFTRSRVAVFCEQGGRVWWPTHQGGKWVTLDDDDEPMGVFLRDGRLVVCTKDVWRVYETRRERLDLQCEFPAPSNVWALLRTPNGGEFAACSDNAITIYRCPSGTDE